MEVINDMQSLKETCRSAFVGAPAAPSATQQQVSETLRHMGLSVKDEDRCPKSGYSIDMVVCRVHDNKFCFCKNNKRTIDRAGDRTREEQREGAVGSGV